MSATRSSRVRVLGVACTRPLCRVLILVTGRVFLPTFATSLQGLYLNISDTCAHEHDAACADDAARLRLEASSGTSRSYALFSTFRGAQY